MIADYPTAAKLDAHYYSAKAKEQQDQEEKVRICNFALQPAPVPVNNYPPKPVYNDYAPRPPFNNYSSRPNFNSYPQRNFQPRFQPNRFNQPRAFTVPPVPRFMYTNSNFCWYHKRFGIAATKCKEPCNFFKDPPPDVKTPIDTSNITFLKD